MEVEEENQKKGKINSNHYSNLVLSEDIEFKLQKVLQDISEDEGNNFQSIITLRMKELAYSKILVLTYEKSYFRLVQALFHIGREYLKFNCYEQALTHLQNAIDKNVKASQTLSKFHLTQSTKYIIPICSLTWARLIFKPKDTSKLKPNLRGL